MRRYWGVGELAIPVLAHIPRNDLLEFDTRQRDQRSRLRNADADRS
jgi:hypothetical protein